MKKILFAFSLVLGSIAFLHAQVTDDRDTQTQEQTDINQQETQDTEQTQTDQTGTEQQGTGYSQEQQSQGEQQQDEQQTESGTGTSGQGEVGLEREEGSMEGEVIAASDLPDAVRQSLQSEEYSDWSVNNAFRKVKDGEIMYAVELSNGSDTKIVKFDAQGNKIKEKDKDKDR